MTELMQNAINKIDTEAEKAGANGKAIAQYIEKEMLHAKIKAQYKDLNKKYYFEQNGLFIRPAADKEEIIAEGQKTLKAQMLIADKAKAEAIERAEELEKKMKLSANPETLKFSFYFEALQSNYNELTGIIESADAGTAEKLKKALFSLLVQMGESLESGEPDAGNN